MSATKAVVPLRVEREELSIDGLPGACQVKVELGSTRAFIASCEEAEEVGRALIAVAANTRRIAKEKRNG